MPLWRQGMQMTVKIVNVFDGNLNIDLPNHLALINLFDSNTGAASCVMDGTYITGIRTAASAVLSARMLSRSGSRIAPVIGAGVQGREHVRLLPLIRDFERINVCSLRFEDAQKLAAQIEIAGATTDVEAAVRESDVVCLAAHSPTPVIRPEWVRRGTHVSSVGYYPPDGELPKDLARASPVCRDARRFSADSGWLRRTRGPGSLRGNDSRSSGSRSEGRPPQRCRDHRT